MAYKAWKAPAKSQHFCAGLTQFGRFWRQFVVFAPHVPEKRLADGFLRLSVLAPCDPSRTINRADVVACLKVEPGEATNE
jgi:hypothetical protein